jgi:hypothetical protein
MQSHSSQFVLLPPHNPPVPSFRELQQIATDLHLRQVTIWARSGPQRQYVSLKDDRRSISLNLR